LQGINENPEAIAVNFRASDGKIKPKHFVVIGFEDRCIVASCDLRGEVEVQTFKGDVKVRF